MLISKLTQTIPFKLPPPQATKSPALHRIRVPSPPPNHHKTAPSAAVSASSASHHRGHVITTASSENDVAEDGGDCDDSVAAFWDYQFLFMSQRAETAEPVALSAANGVVPADFPAGTYYLTGPGIFSDDHGSTVHPLDGHGYLRAFAFERNDAGLMRVKFMARYVRTEARGEEHEPETDTWRFTHRGPFSVLRGGRKVGNTKVMKNVANTSVLVWARRLMCLWEGGDPYEVRSGTLITVGKVDLVMDGSDSPPDGGVGGVVLDFAARLLKPVLYGIVYYLFLLLEINKFFF